MGDQCRKFLATGWVIAIGEPTPTGEIVMSVATVVVAGVLLYEVITCPPKPNGPTESICGYNYARCLDDIRNPAALCIQCMEMCRPTGIWICAGEW